RLLILRSYTTLEKL
ncbi:rCG40961, partial [Rattus norvegicus]